MKSLTTAAFATALALPLTAFAADAPPKVNGKEIPASRIEFVVKANTSQGQPEIGRAHV